MRCVIFGGDGFVGWETAKALASKGFEVLVCDIRMRRFQYGYGVGHGAVDITDRKEVMDFGFLPDDIVINLAAVQYVDKVSNRNFYDTNAVGVYNITNSMKEHGCNKLIHFSSSMAIDPIGPYGRSKFVGDEVCRGMMENGFNITILRPALIVGPGRMGLLSKLFWLIEHNLPVPMIGDGSNRYQMVSVYDCVQAIEKAIECGITRDEYNLVSDHTMRVDHLLQSLIIDTGSSSTLVKTNEKVVKKILGAFEYFGIPLMHKEQYETACKDCILDTTNTKKELGWQPKYSDRQMMLEAYNWYRRLR